MDIPAVALAVASALGILGLAGAGMFAARRIEQRAQEKAIAQQQQLMNERVSAFGTLAAGVLRDIGNPIAAIDGYARAMVEAQRSGEIPPPPAPYCDPSLIVNETRRLGEITHFISGLASAPATQRQLVNVNDIAAQALALLRYEPRLEHVAVATRFDPLLQALPGQADQLLMLVTEVVQRLVDAGARTVEVATRADGAKVVLEVSGDAPEEPPGELLVARSVAAHHRGLIEINWTPQSGARVTVLLQGAPID
ncbi:hypothetical protein [Ramlibacter albus]|uniref:Uncharacterized protein n=1 Tax=Ramlibacter albus TaxID=2079448 RepID=A0A923M7L8_9BURK|nr:hypothetical protein [Ramlibacter albus]MBC5764042.1 hypothetical protein [Ramlibacter albus]